VAKPSEDERLARVRLLSDREHYEVLVARVVVTAKTSVWIATANLKDLHVEAPAGTRARARGRYVSMVGVLSDLARSGVEVRILHGGEPSGPFKESLGKKTLPPKLELRRCPRVHLKIVAVDGAKLYLGSANFTGAGLGAKGDGRRNFEMGVLTEDDVLLDAAQERFERIWSGRECAGCKLRDVCPKPLDGKAGGAGKGAKKTTKRAERSLSTVRSRARFVGASMK
jgi:phosphatidylserine/phosphatidylglycerophosphate/cardiolipin synthase-like enzyme